MMRFDGLLNRFLWRFTFIVLDFFGAEHVF